MSLSAATKHPSLSMGGSVLHSVVQELLSVLHCHFVLPTTEQSSLGAAIGSGSSLRHSKRCSLSKLWVAGSFLTIAFSMTCLIFNISRGTPKTGMDLRWPASMFCIWMWTAGLSGLFPIPSAPTTSDGAWGDINVQTRAMLAALAVVYLPLPSAACLVIAFRRFYRTASHITAAAAQVEKMCEVTREAGELTRTGVWHSKEDSTTGITYICACETWFDMMGFVGDLLPACDECRASLYALPYRNRRIAFPRFFQRLSSGEDQKKIFQMIKAVTSGSSECKPVLYNLRREVDDCEIYIRTYMLPIVHDGKIVARRGATQDVTAQIMEEQALRRDKEQAITQSQQKDTFLATMSHELRTPLTSIIGHIELVAETQLDQTQRELIANAGRGATTLYALINNILDYSKLSAGKIELESHHTNIADLLGDVYLLVKDLSTVSLSIKPYSGPQIEVDAMRLKQVFLNLLSNSLKFTMPGGKVELSNRWEIMPGNLVSLEFEVADTGIGMSPEVLEKLFTPFEQADASISRRFGGTGLGLSISHKLVMAMGGTITVRSKESVGTTFTVKIVQPISPETAPPTRNSVASRTEGPTSLSLYPSPPADISPVLYDFRASSPKPQKGANGTGGHSLQTCNAAIEAAFSFTQSHQSSIQSDSSHKVLEGMNGAAINDGRTEPASDGQTRVLLIEDNTTTQKLVQRMLKDISLDVADNGLIGYEKVRDFPPYNLILCDMMMPVMDGLEATRKIRQLDKSRNTMIVGLTANAFKSHRDNCLAAGMNDFVSKPFTKQGLLDAVTKALTMPKRPPSRRASSVSQDLNGTVGCTTIDIPAVMRPATP
ncbi:uncharacterized protein EV422DRAFT_517246 [Fimicolochytrium jonesii]|uniref:uncharacterized protein n=1 Tax=Fimicolochytrium jonesii TaxID=1396493 RepID=UPI0022FDD12D|nr:uncharacterized protein EV422DRAFT_517246 [Fimicolochytrium jonesii]KAI8825047.1 hypothetical protein EV422DRAFT_517246 [Fimicolochytrium jonesii]